MYSRAAHPALCSHAPRERPLLPSPHLELASSSVTARAEFHAERYAQRPCGARKYDSACWSAFPQCRRSGGDLILVSESVEDLFPPDPVLGEVDRFWWPGAGLGRGELSEGTVWPRGVVVLQVLGHHPAQVMLIDDQQPVEEFPAE